MNIENIICQEYIGGLSTLKIAKKYGFKWDATVNQILKKHNIPRRDRKHQGSIYSINEHYFDRIDSEEKAYTLGLLYADGGNVGTAVFLALEEKDKHILETIRSNLKSTKPLRTYTNNMNCKYYRLAICQHYLIKKLEAFGVVKRKTYKIRFPNFLPSNLHKAFIRGYYDGDGGLCIQQKRNKALITITTNAQFCQDLKQMIEKYVDINCLIFDVPKKQIKRVVISGNRQILKYLNWLYNKSTIHLHRKYDKYLQLVANPKSNS